MRSDGQKRMKEALIKEARYTTHFFTQTADPYLNVQYDFYWHVRH